MLRIERNPGLDDALVGALVELWTAVADAGGAVGFLPPVADAEVRTVAQAALARVRDGDDDLAVAFDGDQFVGFGFLVTNKSRVARHWATVMRLQSDPRRRGEGVSSAVLAELERAARDRGLDRVTLAVRGSTGLERFYLMHGYHIDGRLPGRLRIGGTDLEELLLSKVLDAEVPDEPPHLLVRRLDPDLPLPSYAHPGDAGLDLRAREDVELKPGQRAVIPTGVAVAIAPGYVGLVHPRSGLAARHGLAMVNAPGTIDAGYRGEIKAILVNLDPTTPVHLSRGDRIAQLLIQPVETVTVREVPGLPPTSRGEGGFGSTGR